MSGPRLRSSAAIVLLSVASACGTGSPTPEIGATTLPPGGGPGSGLTAESLRTELLGFADLSMGEMARLATAAELFDPSPDTRAYVQGLQADVASTALALAVEPDPETALQDLMVSITAKRLAVEEVAAERVEADALDAIRGSIGALEESAWTVGSGVYTPDELDGLRQQVSAWWKLGDRSATGVVRSADLPPSGRPSLTKGLFTPITEATRQLEESRLLGERVLFLAERLPTVAVWQAEAAAWDVIAAPETQQALSGLELIAATMERLAMRVDSMPALLDEQREAFLTAFDEREATVGSLVGEVGGVVRDAGPLLESGERLAGLSTDAATSLNETLLAAERVVAALRDASAPGGAMSFEIGEYAEALEDFRVATEALNGALATAEGLAASPRELIDHAAWRTAQLLLLLFVLVVAYRYGLPHLVGRKR